MDTTAVLTKYPTVALAPDTADRAATLKALDDHDGFCQCQRAKVTCLTCPSVKKVARGALAECCCELFVAKESV